jgi:aldehyde:ferredoxin oxidoreductase
VTGDELRQTAQRIVTAKKLFNIQAGWTPEEDVLPDRFLNQSSDGDPASRLTREQLAAAVEAYNLVRGWTGDGFVPNQQVETLRLEDVVPRLADSTSRAGTAGT